MAQHDFNIANQGFPAFRTDLNNVLTAINTSQSGTSRPSGAVAGTIWLDTTSATTPTLKFYDGADDISLATLDYSANTVNWLDSTVVFDIVGDTTPQLGGDLDVNGNSIVSVSNGNITFTPDGTGKVIIDGLSHPTADGTNGQALITNGSGILSFSDVTPADNTVSLAKLTATGTQDATTFLRGDNTFQAVSSDYVLLATTDASASATVSFDGYFSSTYKNYKIIGSYVIPATDAAEVRIRFRKSNADVTTSNYSTVVQHAQGDSGSSATYGSKIWNGSSFKLGNASLDDAASSGGANFELTIYNPLNTNSYKWFTSNSAYINSTVAEIYTHNQSGWLNDATTALSGISFFMSSGNITSGTFKLYGLK